MSGVILLLTVLVAAIIAVLVSHSHRQQLLNNNIDHYLNSKKTTLLFRLNVLITNFGREHQSELKNKMIDAGIYNSSLAKYYLAGKFGLLAVVMLCLVFSSLVNMDKILYGAIALIVILLVPDAGLALRKKRVIERTSLQLPYMLDMMAVCVQTGMTLEAALGYLSEELDAFDRDLCYHIRKTADAAKVQGLEKALFDLNERLPTPEVRSFTLTLIQNLQYGNSIANVLSDLAEDMRKMHVLGMEEKIGKLSAKMSVPLILLIMFPIVILILAPGVMQLSLNMVN